MAAKKVIQAKQFIADVRSGFTDEDLCEKYKLTESDLPRLFKKLIQAKGMTAEELENRTIAQTDPTMRYRHLTRSYSLFSIPVYDTEDLELEGWITDITEKGLQMTGIPAEEGQTRSLLIRADEFHDIFPFAFDAKCKWVHTDETNETLVGFEITDITETGMQELRKLIQLLTIT
jgi:hypothetical protein